MTIFDRNEYDHPIKALAYGGQQLARLRRQVGNNLYRLERGRPLNRPLTTTPVQSLPQFTALPIISPTKANAGPYVYTSSSQQIQRPHIISHGTVLS